MLISLLILEAITLLAVLALVLRKPAAIQQDPRLTQIPDTLIRHEARLEGMGQSLNALSAALRTDLALHRNEAGAHAVAARDAQEKSTLHLSGRRWPKPSSDSVLRSPTISPVSGSVSPRL